MSLLGSVLALFSRDQSLEIKKLSTTDMKKLEEAVRKVASTAGFSSLAKFYDAVHSNKELRNQLESAVEEVLKNINTGPVPPDKKREYVKAMTESTLRWMFASERKKELLLSLVGGNEAFLKSIATSKEFFSELKAETGVACALEFLSKYNTDMAFRARVNTLVEKMLKDERFAVFSGLTPEEVVRGTSAVYLMYLNFSERMLELAPYVGKETAKAMALSFLPAVTKAGIEAMVVISHTVLDYMPGGKYAFLLSRDAGYSVGKALVTFVNNLPTLRLHPAYIHDAVKTTARTSQPQPALPTSQDF